MMKSILMASSARLNSWEELLASTITVQRQSGIMPSGYSYGFRSYGAYNYGSMTNRNVKGAVLNILTWHAYDRSLNIALVGNHVGKIKLKSLLIGSWEFDLRQVNPAYQSSQNMTYWTISIPAGIDLTQYFNTAQAVKIVGRI